MKTFRALALASAILAFAIAVLGSWIRINNAGLTCPDWPLCKGTLVPALQGGVVLEWTHRAIAFAEGFVVLAASYAGYRLRKRIAGVRVVLIVLGAIFAIQVFLGGATVLLGNSPASVMLHWGMGMALLAVLTALALLAFLAPAPLDAGSPRATFLLGNGPAPWLALATLAAFVTMCVGAYVSSSYAGLACASFPSCTAESAAFFGTGDAQFVQMLHRLAAGIFSIVAVVATFFAFRSGTPRVRAFASIGLVLLFLQATLGALNVIWHLPAELREAHAANASAVFLAFVIATIFAALDPLRASQREARTASPSAVGANSRTAPAR